MLGYIYSAFVVWTCDTFENNLEITNLHGTLTFVTVSTFSFENCF